MNKKEQYVVIHGQDFDTLEKELNLMYAKGYEIKNVVHTQSYISRSLSYPGADVLYPPTTTVIMERRT